MDGGSHPAVDRFDAGSQAVAGPHVAGRISVAVYRTDRRVRVFYDLQRLAGQYGFIVTNALMIVSAVVGELLYLRNRRRKPKAA